MRHKTKAVHLGQRDQRPDQIYTCARRVPCITWYMEWNHGQTRAPVIACYSRDTDLPARQARSMTAPHDAHTPPPTTLQRACVVLSLCAIGAAARARADGM